MSKRITRKLPRDVVALLNDYQSAAIRYGEALTIGAGAESVVRDVEARMLKARYRLEKKLKDQGQLAAHGVRILKAARKKVPLSPPDIYP